MKKLLLFSSLVLPFLNGFAQKPLSTSRESSVYTYIYKLDESDIEKFYRYEGYITDQLLHNLIDSSLTGKSYPRELPPGNYLKVYAEHNKINYQLIQNRSAYLKLLKDKKDLQFIITDTQGKEITNAEVLIGNKTLNYDRKLQLYRSDFPSKNQMIQVRYQGVPNFFSIKENSRYKLSPVKWVLERSPVKYIWFPFRAYVWFPARGLFSERYRHRYRNYDRKTNPGYLIFNKPIYKPRDTIKFKAFIVNKFFKHPIPQKRLVVRLKEYGNDNGKVIGYINAYRKGGYENNFVLSDSLKLAIDNNYIINLEKLSALKYDLNRYKGDNENRYISKRKVYASGTFKLEDYELKSIRFSARADKEEHTPGNPVSVYLKAVDENDLPVPDGRVDVLLMSQKSDGFKTGHVFVPDTLWKHSLKLDPVGETKLVIPDSIFSEAHINYTAQFIFLNSNNEQQVTQKTLSYLPEKFRLITQLEKDTLKISYKIAGKETPVKVKITAYNEPGDVMNDLTLALPGHLVVDPNAEEYKIEADSVTEYFDVSETEADLSAQGYRTRDSLYIHLNNPRNIPFWYTIFSGEKIAERGKATKFSYEKPFTANGNVFFVIDYIWGDKNFSNTTTIPYRDKLLEISVKQPLAISPGDTKELEINVNTAAGKPVAGADLTAYAFTRKFQDVSNPAIPYLGKNYPSRRTKKTLGINELRETGDMRLRWERWSREIGLDTIEYYRFTHPATIYRAEEPTQDSITQIAPFIMKDGNIVPVHVLFIDEKPVYFSQAKQLQRYSFNVDPGKHSLRFRTENRQISLNNIVINKGKKLIVGINADTINKDIRIIPMPDTLTRYESDLLNKYFISVVDNFGLRMAVLEQNKNVLLLNPNPSIDRNSNNLILTGPIPNSTAWLRVSGEPEGTFMPEYGYSYEFQPGLLKQKSNSSKYPFSKSLRSGNGSFDYRQYSLTNKEIDSLWKNYLDLRSYSMDLFDNPVISSKGNGKLLLKINNEKGKYFIKNLILYRYDNPDYIRIYPGNRTDLGYLEPGDYRLFLLLKGDNYVLQEKIGIKPSGTNYWEVNILNPLPKDSISAKISDIINARSGLLNNPTNARDQQLMKEIFNEKYINISSFINEMSGRVLDKRDGPLPGVNVLIKGTNIGTTTDFDGRFSIRVPSSGTLEIRYLGFATKEVPIRPGINSDIHLDEDMQALEEVVVTAYGAVKYSLSAALSGRIAGLDVAGGAASNVLIRGNSSLNGAKPLMVIDGVPVGYMDISPEEIESMSVLKDGSATALYGSAAANGVIIITTKKGKSLLAEKSRLEDAEAAPQHQGSLRTNFSDYAFWLPKLRTDENGRAKFKVTFPDDITNWRTMVVAMTNHKQSGFSEGQIKSFKSVSANFNSPQFAIEGDVFNPLGKIMNYTNDTQTLKRRFSYNGNILKENELKVTNSVIDTFRIIAQDKDSLNFEYSIIREDGYFDGERRSVPVFEQGLIETKGSFAALEKDTAVAIQFDPALGPGTFRAEASVLPTLIEEVDRLRNYEYLCNEQLASKLKGLLAEKRIRVYLSEPFKWDKNITEIIKKIQENRGSNGTWGWWKDTNEELWISLHAVEALIEAEKEGYKTALDKQKLIGYLTFRVASYSAVDKLQCLELLKKLDAKVDYPSLVREYEKQLSPKLKISEYEKLSLILLKQSIGLPIVLDSLLKVKHNTMFGNIYWGENSSQFFDNSIQLSLLAYKIVKNEGKHPDLLSKIRNYFLEQRKGGQWNNTYESSLILENILPDVIAGERLPEPSSIILSGNKNETVSKFPYTATFNANSKINIKKTGQLPVYITSYQQFVNKKPDKVTKDFTVDTWFENGSGIKFTALKGGENILLKAEINVRADADFVMIEIPIPAGCSYDTKEQSYLNNEVHREYFKNKVSIFCRKLKNGKYTFTIKLIPRYTGEYTLNPAKAEMMYFPEFYGREDMKKVMVN